MKYTVLGNTGLKVSTIGLGGAQYVYNKASDKAKVVDLVKYAYSKGITLFDTAPFYTSEDVFGEGLKDFPRESFVLTTKVSRYPGKKLAHGDNTTDPGMKFDFTAQTTEESVKNSLQLLQTNYIDVIQIHDFEYAGDKAIDLICNETLPALQRCRERGWVKFIGLASYHLPKMRQVIERSQIKVDTILNHSCLSLIDQELADFMPFIKERGIGVMNGSPLAHGLLTQRAIPPWVRACPELKEASRQAVKETQEAGMPIEKLALCYSYQRGLDLGVHAFLTGSGSTQRLDENLAILENGLSQAEWDMCAHLRSDIFEKLPQSKRNWINDDIVLFNQGLSSGH